MSNSQRSLRVTGPVDIDRPRLLRRLRTATCRRVTVMRAAAGFGKTTLLRQLLAADSRDRVCVAFAHDEAELDETVRRVCVDAARIAPTALPNLPSALRSSAGRRGRGAELAVWLLRHVSDSGSLIVLDDVHEAAAVDSQEFLRTLVSTATSNAWVVSGRGDFGLPSAAWTADGTMDRTIDEDELAFDENDLIAMTQAGETTLREGDRRAILQRGGGWPMSTAYALRGPAQLRIFLDARGATRERFFDALFRETIVSLDDPAQDAVAVAAEIGDVEISSFTAAGFDADWAFRLLAARTPFVRRRDDDRFIFHPLCRHALTRAGRRTVHPDRIAALAAALVASGRPAAAVALLRRRRLVVPLAALIEHLGPALLALGRTSLVTAALAMVESDAHEPSPGIAALGTALAAAPGAQQTVEAQPIADPDWTEAGALDAARRAREMGDDRTAARAYHVLAAYARERDEAPRGAHYSERAGYHAARCGDALLHVSSLVVRLSIAVETGDVAAAQRVCRRLDRFPGSYGERVAMGDEQLARIVLAFATHRLSDATAALEVAAGLRVSPESGALLETLRACLIFVRDDVSAAHRAFDVARDWLEAVVERGAGGEDGRRCTIAVILLATLAAALDRRNETAAWFSRIQGLAPSGALVALAGRVGSRLPDPNRSRSGLDGYSAIMSMIAGITHGTAIDGRPLNATESLVLRHLANGETSADIAESLGLRPAAVRATCDTIAIKLRCGDPRRVVAAARRLGYLDAEIVNG